MKTRASPAKASPRFVSLATYDGSGEPAASAISMTPGTTMAARASEARRTLASASSAAAPSNGMSRGLMKPRGPPRASSASARAIANRAATAVLDAPAGVTPPAPRQVAQRSRSGATHPSAGPARNAIPCPAGGKLPAWGAMRATKPEQTAAAAAVGARRSNSSNASVVSA